MRTPTLVGARVPRARRHPTPTRGSVVGRPAPGTGRRGRRPLPLSHPHPLGPYHSPTRTRLAPTIVPPAPTWSLPFSRPHPHRPLPFSRPHPHRPLPLSHPHPHRPLPLSRPHPLGPYHCPSRTHLTPTIVPPAPTWPLPFSHPHPLGPDVGSTTARRAKSPRRPRRGASTLSLCVHPTRVPCAAKLSPKNLIFFCHRRMPTAYIHVSGFARICAAPNKTRGIRRFGRRVRRVYFFSRPPCAHGGCVVYSWRL